MAPGAEQRTAGQPDAFDVFVNGLGGGVVQTDGAALVAFLAQADAAFVSVLAKVADLEPAGGQADSGVGLNLAKAKISAKPRWDAAHWASGSRSPMFRVKVPYGFTCCHLRGDRARRSTAVSRPLHIGSVSTC